MGSIRYSKHRKYALTFDDVSIVPGYSNFHPRDVDVSTRLTQKLCLQIPIISAAMDTVTESEMAIAMAQNGGLGVIHQYLSIEQQKEEVQKVKRYESWIIENPITIEVHETVETVKRLMEKYDISGIPVTDDGKIVGIITKRDIRFVEGDRLVKDLMTKKLITVHKGISRDEAKQILQKKKIEKLLIIEDQGSLKGLITVKDIMKREVYPYATRDTSGRLMVGAAVGVNDLERVKQLISVGADIITVDSAHGHSVSVLKTVKSIKKIDDIEVIVGNVVTAEATEALISAGADTVKVGIGAGSICTTRVVSGVGVPQITSLMDCVQAAEKYAIPVISDGGIKQYGDIAKALAAGASVVMIGNLLAGTEESPGRKMILEGRLYKEYRGMGSEGALESRYGSKRYLQDPKGKIVPEGIEGVVDYVGSVSEVLSDMVGGLKHAMGYTGLPTIKEFNRKAILVEVSVGGMREAHPSVRISKEPRNYRRAYSEFTPF